MIDRDATLSHHLFEIAVTDPVFAIPADTDQNDVGRKTAAFEIGHSGYLESVKQALDRVRKAKRRKSHCPQPTNATVPLLVPSWLSALLAL
jgi:hypothetical protein